MPCAFSSWWRPACTICSLAEPLWGEHSAYLDAPQPIHSSGATISAPHMHAHCLELLSRQLQPGSAVCRPAAACSQAPAVQLPSTKPCTDSTFISGRCNPTNTST